MVSDDLRSVFHPQEKYEDKCRSGLEWGAFGKWGVTQMERIKGETAFDKDKDKIELKSAPSPGQFWMAVRTSRTTTQGGNVIEVYVPECYPTTSMGSFWEETEIGDRKLLDFLLKKAELPWKQAGADLWIGYLPIKLNKAVTLFEYFQGKVPFEEEKDKAWVTPILDSFRRLNLEKRLGEKTFHNLKSWAFRASLGGVGKPQERTLTDAIPPHYFAAYAIRLRNPKLGYLKRGLGDWTGEGLNII